MHRLPLAVARFLFIIVVGAVATGLGAALALGGTKAGRSLLARVFTDQSGRLVRGTVSIGRIEGNFLSWLRLDSVVVRDTAGFPLATLGGVAARFRAANLIAGRIVLDSLVLTRPRIHLVKHRNGRLNFEEVLKLGEGPDDGGPGQLIEFRNVAITDGILSVYTPWSPPGHLRTDAQRDSALREQRFTPGKRIEEGGPDEGLQQVRTVEGLEARLAMLRISTPDRQPLTIEVETLAARLNDPLLEIRDLAGRLTQARDTLWFDLARAAMPGTRGTAEGLIAWPADTVLFNFGFDADTVALADLRFVSPDFPEYTGRGSLQAFSFSGIETQYEITGLDVGAGSQRVAGRLVALTHRFRGLGFQGLDLALREVDFDVVRPYLDTLPFTGALSGRLQADGYFDDMRIAVAWTFHDTRVPDQPPNYVAMRGPVRLGGEEGFIFRNVQVDSANLDLPTVRLAVPAVILAGRAAGNGILDGPWRNVTFTGHLAHWDGERPTSAVDGRIRTDTRAEIVALDADLTFAPLEFEGIRPTFPTLTALGSVSGPVRLQGPLDRMVVWADLQGRLGSVKAEGTVTALPPRWGADSLVLDFRDLDLAVARGRGPSTRLTGRMVLAGTVDSLVAPEGTMALDLGEGWVRDVPLDSVHVRAAVRDSVIVVDTAVARLRDLHARAGGTLGWVRPHDGRLGVAIEASSIAVFDSVVRTTLNLRPDTTADRQGLDGGLDARLVLSGALDSLSVEAEGRGTELRMGSLFAPAVGGRVAWQGGNRPRLDLALAADTLMATAGRRRFTGLEVAARGWADSLQWTGAGRSGAMTSVTAAGELVSDSGVRRLVVDSLRALVRDNQWRNTAPFTVTLADSVWSFSETGFATHDGSARIGLEGALPASGEGSLDLTVDAVDLRDLYALIQRDTTQVAGLVQLDLRVGGTASDPVIRGTGGLTGPVFGDFRAPATRAAFNYQRRRLDANLTLWRTGAPLMDVNATLPLDLAWAGDRRGRRQLPGELAIRARADSMNLAVVEAFTANMRQVRGLLHADVAVQGTWDAPRLGGSIRVENGSVTVPNLGVRYGPFMGQLSLSGDSILVDTVEVRGREGRLGATGHVRLRRLTRPELGLDLQAQNFVVLDVPDFLSLQADGNVQLRGPLFNAVMTGSATARNSVLYFADLISKSIVNLEDPLYADLVDTAVIRRRGLGAAFQSRFLDSLTINDFGFRAAEGVWLRSNEANVQLEGGVRVQKRRQLYRFDGRFTAVRGTYNLKLLAFTRSFEVTRGEVAYTGLPNLDADLDIEARHLIRPADAGASSRDIEVIARIGGTLRNPRLTLESSIRPPLSQSDIITLLVLRRTVNNQVVSDNQSRRAAQWAGLLASTLTSEIENALVTDTRTGLDLIEIRPGVNYGVAGQSTLWRVAAGWQLGNRWFVSLTAGFCPQFQQFDYRNFGVSLDYRLSRYASASVSAEPIQTCLASATGIAPKRYQFGADLRWDREF